MASTSANGRYTNAHRGGDGGLGLTAPTTTGTLDCPDADRLLMNVVASFADIKFALY